MWSQGTSHKLVLLLCRFSAPARGHSHGQVNFKYKLQSGACPKSYGMHVAALAGILPEICKRADQVGRCAALPEDLQHRHAVQEHPEMALEQAYFVRSRLVTGDRGDKMLTVCARCSALESRLSSCFRNSTAKRAALATIEEVADDSDSDFDVALLTPQVARVLQAAKDGSLAAVQHDLRRLLPALGAL